jgi:hypothetical protein
MNLAQFFLFVQADRVTSKTVMVHPIVDQLNLSPD